MYSTELCESYFTQAPEVFNAIDVVAPNSKFILAMLDPIMLFIPKVSQSIIGSKTVRINDCIGVSFTLNNGHQLACRAVFDDLSIDPVAPLKHSENRSFTLGSAPSLATNPTSPKVALIKLNFTVLERTFGLTKFGYAFTKTGVKFVNTLARKTRQLSCFFSLNIKAEKTKNLSKFTLRNVRVFYILVFYCPTATYKDNNLLKLS